MNGRSLLSGALTALVVVIVAALLVGQLLGQPVLLGYVTTDSMEPALSPGDGFVAVPAQLAGEPDPGDVVVFEAETIQGGELTTHRIVEETDQGYVTKGDANPFTDQDSDEPHVREEDVVAHALQINGRVVAIPFLGTVVSGIRGLLAIPFAFVGTDRVGSVMVFLGIALFVVAGATGGNRRPTSRSRSRENVIAVWSIVLAAAGIVVLAATAAMIVPAGGYEIELIVSEEPSDSSQIVEPGGTGTVTYDVHNGGVIPVVVVTEPVEDGVTVDPERATLGFDERSTVSVLMDAPEETGEYTRQVREARYLLVLPRSVLLALHSVHPLLAILAVDLVAALFVIAVAAGIFGTGYLRVRSGPEVPLRIRIERRLRRFR